jgi:hypothetical protein
VSLCLPCLACLLPLLHVTIYGPLATVMPSTTRVWPDSGTTLLNLQNSELDKLFSIMYQTTGICHSHTKQTRTMSSYIADDSIIIRNLKHSLGENFMKAEKCDS